MQRRMYPNQLCGSACAVRTSGRVLRLVPVALVVVWLAAAPTASASPGPHGPLITYAPSGPFSSGELIEVRMAPNKLFKPGASLRIEECAAPAHRWDDWYGQCDPRTRQEGRLVAGKKGSLNYLGYPLYALPDALALDESARHRPTCDLVHACVLVISGGRDGNDGDHDGDDTGGSVWSLPFFVGPVALDPPPSAPEVPYVLALPVLAGGIFIGVILVRRRRSSPTASN